MRLFVEAAHRRERKGSAKPTAVPCDGAWLIHSGICTQTFRNQERRFDFCYSSTDKESTVKSCGIVVTIF